MTNKTEILSKMKNLIAKQIGYNEIELTKCLGKDFCISFIGNNSEIVNKINRLFGSRFSSFEYDEELNETFCYLNLNA